MAGKVQMDVTGDDVNYFVERGFERTYDDLNCLRRVDQHGWITDARRITGRPFGWRATRVVMSRQRGVIRNWMSPLVFDDPISCYVDAETRGWRYEGETNGDAVEENR